MKRTFLSLLMTLTLLSFSSFVLLGQQKEEKKFQKDKMLRELNLTKDQQNKINEIRFDHEEKQIESKADLEKNQLRIKKMISSSSFNDSELLNLVEKSGQLKSQLEKERVSMWLDIRKILTEDQREIWKSKFHRMGMRDKMRDHRKERESNRSPRSFERNDVREMRFLD